MKIYWVSVWALLLLTGCATPVKDKDTSPGTQVLLPFDDTGIVQYTLDNADVAALWTKSEIARSQKRYQEASTEIESALRIQPDNAVLWSRLAELRMQLGEQILAENYAAKSNAIAQKNRILNYRNWLIIHHARDKRGDTLGAQEAQLQANKYTVY